MLLGAERGQLDGSSITASAGMITATGTVADWQFQLELRAQEAASSQRASQLRPRLQGLARPPILRSPGRPLPQVLAYTVTLTAITNTATASVSLAAYNQMASGFTIRDDQHLGGRSITCHVIA
jgi:hypothetical protein